MSATFPGAIWRTTAARIALLFTALFCAGLGIGLGSLYFGTIGVIDRQTDATLDAEIRALSEGYREGGLLRLVGAIEARTGPDARGDNVYLLAGPQGLQVAGNLSGWPDVAVLGAPFSFPVQRRDGAGIAPREVRALAFDLGGGYRLLVGRDSSTLEEFRARFLDVALWVAAGTLVMGLALGLILGRRVLARVARAAEAGERIAAGNLDSRVPLSGSGDEFDRLAVSVNAMLDRIEALMQGMRIATDSISHDVRKPLTRVRAELDLALRRDTDAAGARAAMARALGQIDTAVGILGRLLDIARAEAGMAGGEWQAVDLARIAEDAAEFYQPLAEERGIALDCEPGEGAPARGEPQLLAQAVANLIDNALKYAPASTGRVRVRAGRLAADGAFIEVADNGPGIPASDRDRVTERFVRLDAARGGEGSGLGLSLVRAVAHLHGGRLVLGDAGPGLSARMELPG